MSAKPILYTYFRSSCSWRVRIALALKGIDYEYRPIDLVLDGGENLKAEYKKLNPLGQVPLLSIDGHSLTQSLPIIEYLNETRPEPPLLPKEPHKKAQVLAVAEIINAGIQPLQNNAVLGYVGKDKSAEWSKHWIIRGFKGLEGTLQKSAGKCCFGDTVTIADLYLVPQVYNANRYGVDMTEFPIISRINDHLLTMDAFTVSHPHCQPDTPQELRA